MNYSPYDEPAGSGGVTPVQTIEISLENIASSLRSIVYALQTQAIAKKPRKAITRGRKQKKTGTK